MEVVRPIKYALVNVILGIALGPVQVSPALGQPVIEPLLRNCGSITFKEGPPATPSQIGFNVELSFDFSPHIYCKSCDCEKIAFIQIVRVKNLNPGPGDLGFLEAWPNMRGRMVKGQSDADLNAWAIDHGDRDAKYGYYNMDESEQFEASVRPGHNSPPPPMAAIMKDAPDIAASLAVNEGALEFAAVTVPVCLDPDQGSGQKMCGKCLLHYEYWSYKAEMNGGRARAIDLSHETAGDWLREAVDLAIQAWNDQGGHEPLPRPDEFRRF